MTTKYKNILTHNANTNNKLTFLADQYRCHKFNILGSGWKKVYYGMTADGFEGKNYSTAWSLGDAIAQIPEFYRMTYETLTGLLTDYVADYEPIDWQIDFKSGARFDSGTHHSELKYGVIEGVDAKVSADLGRLYQLVPLAKAYRATADIKYKNELLAQLIDFMAFNPPEYGAAWRANMNVAIRAANIIAALDILGGDNIDSSLAEMIHENLVAHGDYIFNNLEYPEEHFHPNHFIANLAGLLMVSCVTGNKEWYDYSVKTLAEQLVYQSNPEGSNFEGATAYHCLVLEMVSVSLIYAARYHGAGTCAEINSWLKQNLGENSYNILHKMFVVYRDIVQPDGLIPLIGDNDSGRFLYLEGPEIDKRDYRFLTLIGAALFDDSDLLTDHNECHLEYVETLLGTQLVFGNKTVPESARWDDAGFYIMRDGSGGYAFINCGPVGTNGKGGHAHNDKLALTLQLKGKDIFIDPGIYAYTASEYFRNTYRSVHAHNTLSIGMQEQNQWGVANQWWGVTEETKCECITWECSPDLDVFCGRQYAYERLQRGAIHQRTIKWKKSENSIFIMDDLPGREGGLDAQCGFMLAPECVITSYSEKAIVIERDCLKITIATELGCWKTEPATYSPEYGMKQYTQRLVLKLPAGFTSNTISLNY